jgi:S1-C subfamily serine protease
VIAGVTPGGPAAAAGLVVGDTITAADGHAVITPAALGALVLAHKPGVRVSVTYRDASGASHTATLTLASGPAQ